MYSVLSVLAGRDYLRQAVPEPGELPRITILKPLLGVEPDLEDNLRSFFEQDYPEFELLFSLQSPDDPAAALVHKLKNEYHHVACRMLIGAAPDCLNPKIAAMLPSEHATRDDYLVISDSDVRLERDALRRVLPELLENGVGVVTCPYRAVPGTDPWSHLEALGMNTEFLSGVVTARYMEGMRFALGPLVAVRRETLRQIGGLRHLGEFLADDFRLGQAAAEAGYRVKLSRTVVEHRIGNSTFRASMIHRMRWSRSTRHSRPSGYLGQVFTYPVPLAAMLATCEHRLWPALLGAMAVRILAGVIVSRSILNDRLTRSWWWLIPVQDSLSFASYLAGFFGKSIVWRNRVYQVASEGRLAPGIVRGCIENALCEHDAVWEMKEEFSEPV